MIKILIVEDEPPIARTLERCIEQIDAGSFHVAGKAIHGQDALNILAKEEIDVVITDIRMPVMDGIELLEEIRSRFPDIISVVLSGYEDFSYVRSALRSEAFDYLLKPILPEEIKKLLNRLQPILKSRDSQRRQQELMQVIQGKSPEQKELFECTAVLICAGPFPAVTDDILLPGKIFWENTDLEEIFTSLFGREDGFFIFDGRTVAEKYIILEKETVNRVQSLVQRLFHKLTLQNEINITMVSNLDLVSIGTIGDMIRSLRSCLYNEIWLCSSRLHWYDGKSRYRKEKITFHAAEYHNVIEHICLQEEEKLLEVIGSLIEHEEISQVEFMQMMEVIIADSRLRGDHYSEMLSEAKIGLNDAVSNSTTIHALCHNVTAVLLALGQREQQKGRRDNQILVEEIEQYLITNYSKSISSEILSKKFGLVPSYLSKIFRTAKGISPSEYLTRYRMDRAREIIRAQQNIRISDVARITGYEDPYYFSKTFKKQTGMWPRDFQQSEIK